MITHKKLIEVALPLDAINKASAREKSIRHGHPSTLHLWWARRPLAAARAVIFAQMVDDPSGHTQTLLSDPAKKRSAIRELAKRQVAWDERSAARKEAQSIGDHSVLEPGPEPTLDECVADIERERLFRIIEDLVVWENTTNETVLQKARDEIWQSWRYTCAQNADHPRAKELFDRNKLPAFHDPFAGGGALPLEAQRLGLESYSSDLNPVAVLINKAMIEIPPKFAGKPPVNPVTHSEKSLFARTWCGVEGLAEDVRYYGHWMREEAGKRIEQLYPKIEISAEMLLDRPDLRPYMGQSLNVIAWLWARTVKSPNPAYAQVDVPLATTFMLSNKAGKEVYVEPVIENCGYRFTVKTGKPENVGAAKSGTSAGKRAGFLCLMSGAPLQYGYIRQEGSAGRMGVRLMGIVAEGDRERVYLSPTAEHEATALKARPEWTPETRLDGKSRVNVSNYGIDKYGDLFTSRQLVALTTFSDLVGEARLRVRRDALASGVFDDSRSLSEGGNGATAYAEAVALYLAFVVSSQSDRMTTICTWDAGGPTWGTKTRNTFSRQAIPMSWDFAEVNPLSTQSGSFENSLDYTSKGVICAGTLNGRAVQADAAVQTISIDRVISTDPPYYDNIEYADLSDFFYVWLRRSMQQVFPDLFATVAVPKSEELVATPHRHGGKEKANVFFLEGMTRAMQLLAAQAHPAFPVTIYYAFKQSETETVEGTSSTGWETFLEAVIRAGFAVSGTWPMRTELSNRMIGSGTNALASSIVLVCRKRDLTGHRITRREFVTTLRTELPQALAHLQAGNIAPVDLAQAAIGPGMSVYTRFLEVLDAEGKVLTVRDALSLINHTLDESLAEQEGDFDADSRWALAWFGDYGFADGPYGDAHTYFVRFNTAENALKQAGIIDSGRSRVRLLRPDELPTSWDPTTDSRLTAWEVVHHLIRVLEHGGEGSAATIVARLGAKAEIARELAYRLYTVCERNKRAAEALSYNGLVQSWPEITRLARDSGTRVETQSALFGARQE